MQEHSKQKKNFDVRAARRQRRAAPLRAEHLSAREIMEAAGLTVKAVKFTPEPVPQQQVPISTTVFASQNADQLEQLWAQSHHEQAPREAAAETVSPVLSANIQWGSVVRQVAMFASVALVVMGIFQGAKIVASTIQERSVVLGAATDAVDHLKSAQSLVSQRDLTGSMQELLLAEQGFTEAQQDIHGIGGLLNGLIQLNQSGRSATALLDAGQNISRTAQQLDAFYVLASGVKVTASGVVTQDSFSNTVQSAVNYLNAAHLNMQAASADLENVDAASLPAQYRDQFIQYRSKLPQLAAATGDAAGAIGMLGQLVGPGPKTLLVLFENNNELRADGGFIGTYGFFRFNDGQIVSQKISSIYDLDGQLGAKVPPPGPFYAATDRWGIRDSNWFADFSQSARKASGFYEQVGHETPDAVIAMTPDIFVDLLKATGPIDFPKYNVTLSADNFRDVVQANTSDETSATPKQMLSDFEPLLLQRVADLSGQSGTALLGAVLQNLAAKNILVYSSDPALESQLEQYNWAGTVAATSRDYLMVNNSNIGGEKTDLSVSQSATLDSKVQPDGSIVNTLTYTRTRGQDLADGSINIDYVRFLVPQGSTLLSSAGFSSRPYHKADGSAYPWDAQSSFSVDPDLAQIDATATVDRATGTVTQVEAGKTEFANWMEVGAGQSATATLTYRLPFKVTDADTYSLTVQKQPGNNPIDFSYNFNPGRPVIWFTPDDWTSTYRTQLSSDLFIGELFKGAQ